MANLTGPKHTVYSYKLRTGGLTPIGPSSFFIQSFGVDVNEINIYPSTEGLPDSDEDFTGAAVDGEYISANFQRLPFVTTGGQQIFSGQTVGRTQFDESREDEFLNRY